MFAGGWGRRAGELLDAATGQTETAPERCGSLSVLGLKGAAKGEWRCWFSGRLTAGVGAGGEFSGAIPDDPALAIASACERHGRVTQELLRGTFLLVAVKTGRDVASISRDHLGGRPLVYALVGDGAVFAEHEREILDLLPSRPGPDRQALQQWVETGTIPTGRTLYEGIHRVPPAHQLMLSAGAVTVERYWSPRYEEPVGGTRWEIAERLRGEVFAAVGRAAAGSNRVCVRLSGGLDSACVAAGLSAREGALDKALALSAVFPQHPATDERPLLEETARHTGLRLEELVFDEDSSILDPALRHIERWSLPPVTPNAFIWEPVMVLAKSLGVDAMLDGEGGDELFGLAPLLIADALAAGRLPTAWALAARIPGLGEDPGPRVRLRALRAFGIDALAPGGARRLRARRAAGRRQDSLLTRRDRLALTDLDDGSPTGLDGPRWWQALAAELTGAGEAFDVAGHLRREAIAGGIDRRHPFSFDRDLVSAVLALPPELQFDPVRDRALLRDAVAGYIPEAVRRRYTKSYFTPVLRGALAGRAGDRLAGELAAREAPIRDFLDSRALDRLLDGEAGRRTFQLWRAGTANLWLKAGESLAR